MRTVLLGSDFMYDKGGNLKPIEINTAVGWDGVEKLEENEDCLDLTGLYEFVNNSNFQTIHYIGDIMVFNKTLESHYSGSSVTYHSHPVSKGSLTIPSIDDNETTLIIRSAYDTTAIVDDVYCRSKVEFMKLIQSQSFGSQFAYIDENNNLVSNITTITDNGIHPNFILKSNLPGYDVGVFPKFFKVTNQAELDLVISENVTSEYFLMENYVNEEKVWNGHLKVIRSLNLLYPPTLDSIQLGQYTKINQNLLQESVTYNNTTFELDSAFRESYLTNLVTQWGPKLLDTDMVEMSDGTFKTALDLEVGDLVKTIAILTPDGVTKLRGTNLTYQELVSGTTYSSNEVIYKKRVNRLAVIVKLTFEDNSDWEDIANSSYLVDINGTIEFRKISDLVAGDVVLLLNTENENVDFVRKTVVSNVENRSVFSGWIITVANEHLFLTKTSSTNNVSYVSIESNSTSCNTSYCPCFAPCPECPKFQPYCQSFFYGGQCTTAAC
jgi:hypothetical protein